MTAEITYTKYIVSFRTIPAGSYKWLKGARRGYYQLLAVEPGCKGADLRYRGVTLVRRTEDGIEGVTARSRYCLDSARAGLEYEASRLTEITRLRAHAAYTMARIGDGSRTDIGSALNSVKRNLRKVRELENA